MAGKKLYTQISSFESIEEAVMELHKILLYLKRGQLSGVLAYIEEDGDFHVVIVSCVKPVSKEELVKELEKLPG